MTRRDIRRLVEAHEDAARRSLQAGFDGLQLHAAHGHGISQFLSEAWNRRTDEYGGSVSNRYRSLEEVIVPREIGPLFCEHRSILSHGMALFHLRSILTKG